MSQAGRTAGLGVGAAVAVVVLLGLPYALSDPRAIEVYYESSLLGPSMAGLFAAIAAIALLAGARGRTDPPMAAGVALVFGALVAGLLSVWAVGVSAALVGGMTTVAAFEFHRWALVAAGVVLLAGAAAYARRVV